MLEKARLEEETKNAINWIKEYIDKTNAKGVVVGNSGGKDSGAVIAMATKALGKEKVLAVSMPCNSINADFEDAKLVAEIFGVRFIKVDLSSTYKELENSLNYELKEINVDAISKESSINIKPRLRMTTLYGIAQTLRIFSYRHRKSLRSNGPDILQNGEIVVLTLIRLVILQ